MSARSVIALFVIVMGLLLTGFPDSITASTKDGFNIYKDLMREKSEEEEDISDLLEEPRNGKVSYFYRTPPQIAIRGRPAGEIGKRTLNHFKNYMLEKGSQPVVELLRKRGSGSVLGWALANQQNLDHE